MLLSTIATRTKEYTVLEAGTIAKIIDSEFDELIHKLEVQQIELEMQNEDLIKAHLELEESRDEYFQLYDLAPVGYLTLDEYWIIKKVNLKLLVFLISILIV